MVSLSNAQDVPFDDPEILNVDLVSENQNSISLSNKARVGKIRTMKKLNIKAVKEIIAKAWSTYSGLHITELGKNMFLFTFNQEADAVEVLKKAP